MWRGMRMERLNQIAYGQTPFAQLVGESTRRTAKGISKHIGAARAAAGQKQDRTNEMLQDLQAAAADLAKQAKGKPTKAADRSLARLERCTNRLERALKASATSTPSDDNFSPIACLELMRKAMDRDAKTAAHLNKLFAQLARLKEFRKHYCPGAPTVQIDDQAAKADRPASIVRQPSKHLEDRIWDGVGDDINVDDVPDPDANDDLDQFDSVEEYEEYIRNENEDDEDWDGTDDKPSGPRTV